MPSRSSPNSDQLRFSVVMTRRNNTTFGASAVTNGPLLKWTDTVTFGENLKGWRSLLRRGLSATTSMTGSSYFTRSAAGVLSMKRKGTAPLATSTVRGDAAGDGFQMNPELPLADPTGISLTEANAQALGRFVQNSYDIQHSLMGGVVIGELAQTIQTIRNPAKGLRGLVDNWRDFAKKIRGQRVLPLSKRKATVMENLADAWLEVQFGWKPLLNDIRDGSKALDRYNTGQGLRTRRITGTGKENKVTSGETRVGHNFHNVVYYNHVERSTSHCIVVYRGAMRVEARDPKVMDPKLIGFDLASWAPTAWELVPYSFLIDYFSNVGEIITGWSSLGTRYSWVNKTTIRYYENFYQVEPHPQWDVPGNDYNSGAVDIIAFAPATVVTRRKSVSRSAYTGLLVPPLNFEIPGSGSLKWLNMAALIANRKSDRKWSFD